jgi:hypothetical protein
MRGCGSTLILDSEGGEAEALWDGVAGHRDREDSLDAPVTSAASQQAS